MNHIEPFSISGLLITLFYFPLFIFILQNGKTGLAKTFSLHIFSVFLWGIASFFASISSNEESAFLLYKIAATGVFFIPIFLLHAVDLISQKKATILTILGYIQATLFTILMYYDLVYSGVKVLFNSFFYYKPNFLFTSSFIFWLIFVILAHLRLYIYYKKTYEEEKKQILYIIAAFVGFLGGASNFLPVYNLDLYPYGNFLVPIHSFLITYAILKHHLFNIRIALKESLVYYILITLLPIIYLIIILVFERSLQNMLLYNSTTVSILIAFILGILFFPLRNAINAFVNKAIFEKTHEEILSENVKLKSEVAETQKLKAVATLASGMAHEIKNPLTSIKTFTEHLPQKYNDPKFIEKFSRIVGYEVDRINNLVHELLDFAKPAPLHLRIHDISQTIDQTLELLNNQLIQKKIQVTRNTDKNLPRIYLDPNQLKQSFLNIFLNSIEAMPSGGLLNITTHYASPKLIEILIRDTGQGIKKKDLSRVFDPFYSQKDQGTGLGLSITHGIITQHGGSIKVHSEPGKYTEFSIILPIKPSPSQTTQ